MKMNMSSFSVRVLALCALSALLLTGTAFANSETIVRSQGAGFVSEAVTPWILDVDLRDLPKSKAWQPGDPLEIVPEGVYEDRAVAVDPNWQDPIVQPHLEGGGFSSSVIVSFQTHPFGAGWPPDVNGDIGPEHYISMVNASNFAIWDKQGNAVAGPSDLSDLWGPNGGAGGSPCADGDGDPIVRYDSIANRWIMTEFDLSGNTLCFYVARTADPVAGGWWVYDFSAPSFPDYPQYGIWTGAWYVTSFESPNIGIYAFDKINMLAGNPATFQRFTTSHLAGTSPRVTRMLPLDLDGGVAPPSNSGLFTRTVDATQDSTDPNDRIEMWQLDVNFGNPPSSVLTQLPDVAITEFTLLPCAPSVRDCIDQPGVTEKIDALFNRPLRRAAYRNFGTYETFVMTQVVDAGGGVAGKRWWEIRRDITEGGGSWAVHQESTFSPDATGRFMGSMAFDDEGNIALGYSASSSSLLPEVRVTGRRADDPLNTMTMDELTLKAGEGVQTSNQRWGDYSAMNVDPADGVTFWYTNEIVGDTGFWTTWVGSFRISTRLFEDGFEGGDVSAWTTSSP